MTERSGRIWARPDQWTHTHATAAIVHDRSCNQHSKVTIPASTAVVYYWLNCFFFSSGFVDGRNSAVNQISGLWSACFSLISTNIALVVRLAICNGSSLLAVASLTMLCLWKNDDTRGLVHSKKNRRTPQKNPKNSRKIQKIQGFFFWGFKIRIPYFGREQLLEFSV